MQDGQMIRWATDGKLPFHTVCCGARVCESDAAVETLRTKTACCQTADSYCLAKEQEQ